MLYPSVTSMSGINVSLNDHVKKFQTSTTHRDIDTAAKLIGAGMATIGVSGSGEKIHKFL